MTGFISLVCILFVPRSYAVEDFMPRQGTQYWNLKTGSTIGYFKLESSQELKRSPIIYLHGGPGGMVSDLAIGSLSKLMDQGHDMYFYDQVGSGHSERLDDISEYSVNRHQEDLEEIIRGIGSEKVILIGHSWGAILAVSYLQDNPQSIEKLVLSGPGPIMPINWKLAKLVPPKHLSLKDPEYSNQDGNKKVNTVRSRFNEKWAQLFHSKLASDQEADAFFTHLNLELSKSTDCTWDGKHEMLGGLGYYSHVMTVNSFWKQENKKHQLGKIKTPMLILRGQCDNQKWGFVSEYLDLFENAELKIIEGVGHSIINKAQKEYFILISEFLSE